MRRRPRRAALGLRGRILGVVLVTAVTTLAVAAVALLGPLEHSLRDAELKTLQGQVTKASTQTFRRADPAQAIYPGNGAQASGVGKKRSPNGAALRAIKAKRNQLYDEERDLGSPIGASDVVVLGNANAAGLASTIVAWPDPDLAGIDPYDDAAAAFKSSRDKYTLGSDRRCPVRPGCDPVHDHRRHGEGHAIRPALGAGRPQAAG